jgi:16S rRNA (cytosine967-C5)-methyltransferase
VPSDPRKTALLILNKVEKSQKPLDRFFEDTVDPGGFTKRDRALLQALVYGVLRWRGRLDYIISFFSTTAVNKIDSKVLNILRLGLFQIIYMSKIPDSAAVNTAVELAKSNARPMDCWVCQCTVAQCIQKPSQGVVPGPPQRPDPWIDNHKSISNLARQTLAGSLRI